MARCGFVLLVLALAAGPAIARTPGGAAAQIDAIATGRSVYQRHCAGCHGAQARGNGPDAALCSSPPPDLRASRALDAYTTEELVAFVRSGQRLRLGLRPEKFEEHERQSEDLYRFLLRIPKIDWERVDEGEAIYMHRCLQCHERLGHPKKALPAGVRWPEHDLSDPAFQAAVSDGDLRLGVRHGLSAMPGLVPRITDAEASALVAYVRILSPGYELYSLYCEQCHGRRGEGARGVIAEAGAARFAFDEAYFEARSPDRTRRAVWHMLSEAKPAMPHFSYLLTPAQVRAILTYLRSLRPADGSRRVLENPAYCGAR